MELTCPKCQGTMRTYERNGVTVDQCADCRGIFLDRGELERLVDAEQAWHGGQAAAPAGGRTAAATSGTPSVGAIVGEVLQQAKAGKQHGSGSDRGYPPRRKKSFLDELFG